MWFLTTYEPVSLISLKMSTATSTGGKSLLLPTPFAFKMALLNVIIQTEGLAEGKNRWNDLRNGRMAVRGPEQITVNNTFTKILKPSRGKPDVDPDTGVIQAMGRSIGFREYVQWQGQLQVAFAPAANQELPWGEWLTQINYIGKRGGFIQATEDCTE